MKFLFVLISYLVLLYGNDARFGYDKELYSSSVVGLKKLLEEEDKLVKDVNTYSDMLYDRLETLKEFLKTLDRPDNATQAEREEYVSNPLKAFELLRRIKQEWVEMQAFTKSRVGTEQLEKLKELVKKKPTEEDLKETLQGMSRIEEIYDLNPYDISQGRLQDKQFDNKLSLRDSLAIANHKYKSGDYARAAMWYRIVLKREPEPNSDVYNEVFGKPLVGVRRKFGTACLLYATSQIDPTLSAQLTQVNVDKIIAETSAKDLENYISMLLEQNDQDFMREMQMLRPKTSVHDMGCRGLFPKRTNLSCRYNFTTTPFLRIAPLKMEEINHDPYIVMYHNVLYDSEILDMKQQSKNMFNGYASAVKENQTEKNEIVARVNWLTKNTTLLKRINQRIQDMTGFNLDEFPALQVANYGIGRYFKPHYDYMSERVSFTKQIEMLGDRMGSLIFYASEVPQGGATVFPELQVAVPPQKGNSLFWFNIFDDGTPDPRSLHSVCPVIVGSRWTLTKWLHVAPQMFIKPCKARPLKKST